jgi:hypothetical protein
MPPTLTFALPGCEITAVSPSAHGLTLTAPTTASTTPCPRCGLSSLRIHSYYTRRPPALPLWDAAVRLVRLVRRCRCLNATCTVQTCAARLAQVVQPAAQRPVRWTPVLQHVRRALGGAAGARLGAKLHVSTSPDTLRRLVRQLPHPPLPRRPSWGSMLGPCVVGVPMAPCWSTWSAIGRSPCGPPVRRIRLLRGARCLQAFSSVAVTARQRMRTGPPLAHQKPNRSSLGGISSAICGKRSNGCLIGFISAWRLC